MKSYPKAAFNLCVRTWYYYVCLGSFSRFRMSFCSSGHRASDTKTKFVYSSGHRASDTKTKFIYMNSCAFIYG